MSSDRGKGMNANAIKYSAIGVLGVVIDLVLAPEITVPLWKLLSEGLHSSLATADLGWEGRATLMISDVGTFVIFVGLIGFVTAHALVDRISALLD